MSPDPVSPDSASPDSASGRPRPSAEAAPSLASVVRTGEAALRAAGVVSAGTDAVALAAHALGCSDAEVRRRMVLGRRIDHDALTVFEDLVARRRDRIPLQHLTGTVAFRRLELRVGPGVFVPRPETEVVAQAAIDEAAACGHGAVVVDLCAGSAAIALAVGDEAPDAHVVAVEVDPMAAAWAAANIEATGLAVELVVADATTALPGREGTVDVVVSNPPYIPVGMVPVDPEVRDHDPGTALYGGSSDGLHIPLAVAARAADLLAPGGLLVMEHADTQGETLPERLRRTGRWEQVEDHPDLSGRPRYVTARRR